MKGSFASSDHNSSDGANSSDESPKKSGIEIDVEESAKKKQEKEILDELLPLLHIKRKLDMKA